MSGKHAALGAPQRTVSIWRARYKILKGVRPLIDIVELCVARITDDVTFFFKVSCLAQEDKMEHYISVNKYHRRVHQHHINIIYIIIRVILKAPRCKLACDTRSYTIMRCFIS